MYDTSIRRNNQFLGYHLSSFLLKYRKITGECVIRQRELVTEENKGQIVAVKSKWTNVPEQLAQHSRLQFRRTD